MESDSQSSLSTLIPFPSNHPLAHSSAAFQDDGSPRKPISLPTRLSYALRHCIDTSPIQDPVNGDSLPSSTLLITMPGQPLPCQHPDHQPPPLKPGGCQRTNSLLHTMSSSIPSTGDETLKGKSHNTNNSASRDLVTPWASKKKGKGVSMAEEPDPKAISPTNGNSMPVSGPVLTGPHLLDTINPGETTSSPAASQSVK